MEVSLNLFYRKNNFLWVLKLTWGLTRLSCALKYFLKKFLLLLDKRASKDNIFQ